MDKAEAIKILKDFHDESAIFSVRTALETLHPELKESEDERVRKGLMKAVAETDGGNKLYGSDVTREEALAWLEKQDHKKHVEELDAAYKTADSVQYKRGYEAARKELEELGQQPRMQNGITINGVEYELIEDDEADECERCALKDMCNTIQYDTLCYTISDIAASHRFEKR
jgi:hypothetical protein